MVCDCGGLTVVSFPLAPPCMHTTRNAHGLTQRQDITASELVSVQPLTLGERISEDGGLCGAVFLDEGFSRAWRAKIAEIIADPSTLGPDYSRTVQRVWEEKILAHYHTGGERRWLVPGPPGWANLAGRRAHPDATDQGFLIHGYVCSSISLPGCLELRRHPTLLHLIAAEERFICCSRGLLLMEKQTRGGQYLHNCRRQGCRACTDADPSCHQQETIRPESRALEFSHGLAA
jgi:hypothetical protein